MPIDYELMRMEQPRLKAALTRAVKTKDPVKIADACIKAVAVWDRAGAWPDNWHDWNRALGDALPWNQQVPFTDVVYGHVKVQPKQEVDW